MSLELDHLFATASAVIPLASVVASALNHYIREKTAAGVALPAWLVSAATALNVASVNLDKAAQLAKMLKRK